MLDDMVGSFSDRAGYEAYVRSVYAFRLPLERALLAAALPPGFLPWSPLMISEALEEDVLALDLIRPDLLTAPAIDTPEALYGLLYTLEGSSLGAQVLVKRAAAIGFGPGSGAAHLTRQAGSTDSWRSFCTLLEAAPDLDMDGVSEAACATFGFARQSFSRHQSAGGAPA